MTVDRNSISKDGYILKKVDMSVQVVDFDCGDGDLNDYFNNDSANYKKSLLTQTYALYDMNDETHSVVALVDFCNDSLARKLMTGSAQRRINHHKRGYSVYPAIKITRLGIDRDSRGTGIGSNLLTMIKEFFITDNRSGCRFITVDAYREAVPFYQKNGFVLAKTEEDEEDRNSSTVPLFFDLMRISLPVPK